MTRQGFSAVNLEHGAPMGGVGGAGGHRRVAKMVAALILLSVLAVQLILAMRTLHDPRLMAGALLVGLAVTALILRRPDFGLLVTIALVPLESLASRHSDPLSLFKIFGGLTFVAFLLDWAFRGRYPHLVRAKQNGLVIAAAVVLLFSSIFTTSADLTVTSLRRFATLFIFYFLITNMIINRRLLRATAWLIMIPVAISAGVAVASYHLGRNLFPADFSTPHAMLRAVGTSRDANFFAATILVAVPFYFYYFLYEKRRVLKALCLACLALSLLAIVYSFSRGGGVATGLVILAIAWGERHRVSKRTLALAGAGVVVFGLLLIPFVPREYGARLASLGNWRQDDSLNRRGLYLVFGTELLLGHPLTGVGPGAFLYMMDTEYQIRFPVKLRSEGEKDTKRGRAAHNMYLELAAELGFPGILVFGWLFLLSLFDFRRLVRRFEREKEPELWAMARAGEVAYWGFLITSLFLSAEYRKYLWLLLALPVVLRRLAGDRTTAGIASRESPAATGRE